MPTDNIKFDGTLCIYDETGKVMELGKVLSIDIDNNVEELNDFIFNLDNTLGDKECIIECKNCFANRQYINKIFYNISNNYLRLHGGHALRERQRYKVWRNKCGRNRNKTIS